MPSFKEIDLSPTDPMFLEELRDVAGSSLEAHLTNSKIWYPHEFAEEIWEARFNGELGMDNPLPPAVVSALYVNLLTEDNLPYYHKTISEKVADQDHPFSIFGHRWTAEEARHSIAIRDFMTAARVMDPYELEDSRMAQVSGGKTPVLKSFAALLIYTPIQEKATRIAHRNTGHKLPPEHQTGKKMLGRVAGDEGHHEVYYDSLTCAAIEVDPSTMVIAGAKTIIDFEMPGTGIKNYKARSAEIALAGIYSLRQYKNDILDPALSRWKLLELTGLTPEAEQAQSALRRWVKVLARATGIYN